MISWKFYVFTFNQYSKIKIYFSLFFYERGLKYYHQGRVKHIKWDHRSNKAEIISSTVAGSKPYQVTVTIHGPENKIQIRGVCSCPMVLNCKHVIATLLQALDQLTKEDNNTHIIPVPEIKNDPQVELWLQKINKVFISDKTTEKIDETYCLVYLISAFRPMELQVKLSLVRRLKSGNWGALKKFSSTAYSHEKHLYPVDHELLIKLEVAHKLSASSRYFDNYLLNGAAAEKILPELIATGRCCWESKKNPALKIASSKKAELNWQADENGFQMLRCCVEGHAVSAFSVDRIWYMDKTKWELGLLDTGLDTKIARALLTAPKIPPEQERHRNPFLVYVYLRHRFKYQEVTKINGKQQNVSPLRILLLIIKTCVFLGKAKKK